MTPQDFVSCIRNEVVEQNLKTYGNVCSMPADEIRDPQWREIARACSTMTESQLAAVSHFTKKAMIDTASSILGILDGTCILANYRKLFFLKYGDSDVPLNGDLQDFFLADLEDNP
jgi:hypothetical protein